MRKQKIAVLMILLVIMLPIYSASVFAGLSNIEARGQDNVKNFVKETDFIIFKATASITGDTAITPNQVFLGSSLQFDNCTAGMNSFDCTLRFPASGTDTFSPAAIPYTIVLKNDAGNIIDTKTDNLYVDNLPPAVNSFDVDQPLVSSGTVKFSYEVSDSACSVPSCSGKCSGIKEIKLFEVNGNFEETITLNTDSCTVSDTFETSSIVFSEGEHAIFAQAFDKIGFVSATASISFKVDTSAPFIDLNTFKIIDASDVDIGFFGTSPTPVTVRIDIKDSDLDKSSVVADLNELNKQGNLGNVQGTCGVTIDEITTCSWQIFLAPSVAGQKTVTIEASDVAGNEAKNIITKSLELDSTGPVVLSLASSSVVEGQSFAKLNDNTFTATFREEGVGVKPADMILHFGTSSKQADACSQVLDMWGCTWNNINFNNAGKINVFIDTDSKDRLGNAVSAKFSKEVIVDNTKPKLLKLIIRNIGGAEGTFGNFTKTGDKIQVEAALEDDSIATAIGDFSRFIFNAKDVAADACVKTGDRTFVCSWTTASIDIEGFIDDFIRFEFTDVAGNSLSVIQPFTAYGVSGEETPDFFTSSVQCSPSLLDRETFSLISQRAFCLVSLTPRTLANVGTFENVETLSISLGECTGDTTLVESVEVFNNGIGSTEPIIKVNFKQQEARVNEVNLLCPLDIISRKGNNIVTVPEKENIDISFGFYNLPVGEVSDEVQKKIDDAIEDANGIWEVVTWLNKLVFYAKRICQFLNIWKNLVATYQLITIALGNAEKLAELNPIAYSILHPNRVGSCLATEGAKESSDKGWEFLNKFCGFVNCKQSDFKYDTDGKWTGWMGEWQQGGNKLIGALGGDILKDWTGKTPGSYMNPKDSIVVATLTMCIPGIIHGLDKYRQIQCMYADCLQTGVGKQGLPPFACEDQKEYATCKYIVGEVFKVIPFTALFNYYINLVRNVLSNPFKIVGAGLALGCATQCPAPLEEPHTLCISVKIASMIGETLQDVTNMIDQGVFTIRDDFCDNLEEEDEEEEDSGGLFS